MQYEYDTNGDLSSLVLMTFLLVVLAPLTYRTLRPKRAKSVPTTSFPIRVDGDDHVASVTGDRPKKSSIGALYQSHFSFKNVFLVAGWAVVSYLGYQIATTERETNYWNPYEILGISESATEKEIKKHYKRLSIKFHPDKVRLAVNQTLEDVQEQFVGLTKAYKALTDEDVRQNFLDYGHPDGKQDLSVGIALPSWMVEGGQSLWVLAAYCITLLVGLPVIVGRWWYRSARLTKDGLDVRTAERYFKGIEDKMTTDQLVSLLCSAAEFDALPVSDDQIDTLASQVTEASGVTIQGKSKSAEALLRAHISRIPLKSTLLLSAQQVVLDQIINLHRGLYNIAQSYGYLDTQMQILELSPAIVQAVTPGQSALLQLPFVTKDTLEGNPDITLHEFLCLDDSKRKKLLGLTDDQYRQAIKVAKGLPDVEALRVAYQVEGDSSITGNAIVQLVFKLRRVGGPALKEADLHDAEVDEGDVEAILNINEVVAATAVPDTLSWAPYFPSPPKNNFWLSMSDRKQDRVIVGPLAVEDIGEKLRTFKIPFQAPPNAGLYTFQVHIKSDTYLGMDKTFFMELKVEEESAIREKEEDEISEPDEDSMAGQMAAMRGGPTKKVSAHEYDSSSEEELDDSSDDDSD